jgi:hypothetical protein
MVRKLQQRLVGSRGRPAHCIGVESLLEVLKRSGLHEILPHPAATAAFLTGWERQYNGHPTSFYTGIPSP